MGGKTTKLFRGSSNQQQPNADAAQDEHCSSRYQDRQAGHPNETTASPFVRYRRGSMYMDEDGDFAHEFYVETKQGTNLTLTQISNNLLTPQGDVLLDVPCIRNDYPVVLLDQSKVKE